MAYKLSYKKSVEKDLRRINVEDRSRIMDKIETELIPDPFKFPQLKGQFSGLRKLRIGNYRVIFSILEDEVLVLRIGHRGIVYR